ncbi:potassium-transporting ATPase subunit KdpC [Massilia terrae]|uniref:Potassium-transporting ATPase KdpC subunit n=1 Tax=Massilia terrae TaxID=1811224 RepID=A0ABT2CUZ8_9BURK|nr:potassium-transporting ATPase subunit KdpC [Massilia terrae]MCS0657426.1 potassium-transporting ATPase subunit KdpC [Massilia terrae]
MNAIIRPALVLFAVLSAICGLLYPLAVTGIGQAVFPRQAEGSMLAIAGKDVGSELIGQSFSSPRYFWGRPSATTPMPNNAAGSGGSNLGATNPALAVAVRERLAALGPAGANTPVPVDLVTASASGIDPDISINAAVYQAARVAAARNVPLQRVLAVVDTLRQDRILGLFGEPRINVLALNLALDGKAAQSR